MKYIKYLALLLVLVLCGGLTACSKGPEPQYDEVIPSEEFIALDGTWKCEDGRMIYLDSMSNRYLLQMPSGRVGGGVYLPVAESPVVKFDGTSYLMTVEGETLKFKTQGTPGGESLDGAVFTRSETRVIANSQTKLRGTWISDSGNQLALDFDRMVYEFRSAGQTVSGDISDGDDGKGLYLSVDGTPVYFAVAKGHESFVLEGASPLAITQGIYTKDGSSADLSAYSGWMDTWCFMGDAEGRQLVLLGTGSWESYDESGNKDGSGRLKTDESYNGGLGLVDESGALIGVVTLGAEDQLFLDPDPSTAETQMEYYLRKSVSE